VNEISSKFWFRRFTRAQVSARKRADLSESWTQYVPPTGAQENYRKKNR